MSFTPIFIPTPTSSTPPEPDRCPHCNKILPKETCSFLWVFMAIMGTCILFSQLCAFGLGAIQSRADKYKEYGECARYPETRAGLLVPSYWVGCKVGEFFKEGL